MQIKEVNPYPYKEELEELMAQAKIEYPTMDDWVIRSLCVCYLNELHGKNEESDVVTPLDSKEEKTPQ